MTKLDFYILGQTHTDANQFICRLTEKIYKSGHRCYIQTDDAQHSDLLDKLLWTFRDRSFIPHCILPANSQDTSAPEDAVVLGHDSAPDSCSDVLINLSSQVPDSFSRFTRVVEIVSCDEQQKQLARSRYKFYKDRGYQIASHQIE